VTYLEPIIFTLYSILGPMAWGFYNVALEAGRRKMVLMKRPPHPIKGEPPTVSILIPAKDEGERIRDCLKSALKQDYPAFDVIAIDDRSTDNTGAVMDQVAQADSRLHVMHITKPPAQGWTGKNNALFQGTRNAKGSWLLYVDSDVILEPDALSVAMSVVLRKEFDMLSLLPRLESHAFWEGLLIPLCAGAASTMYMIALSNRNELPKQAFANGQFLLISRSAYDAIGGHETVRDRYCEDVAIARLMKSRGMRPRVSWGNEFCSVRMYDSLGSIIRGWSRIYYSARVGSPWRILLALLFILVSGFSCYPALAWGIWRTLHPIPAGSGFFTSWNHFVLGPQWLIASGLHLIFMTAGVGRIYQWSGNSRKYAALFPLAGAVLSYIMLRALKMCFTKKVEWRGTAYSHTMQEVPGEQGPAAVARPAAERSQTAA
jgi:glycosyltransferase involved in cell wall biosynthesis